MVVLHVLTLAVQSAGLALPFLLLSHARHGRWLIACILLLTGVSFVLFVCFTGAWARADLVFLRCYTTSSAFCSLLDLLLTRARADDAPAMPPLQLVFLGLVFLLALVALVGGINGAF